LEVGEDNDNYGLSENTVLRGKKVSSEAASPPPLVPGALDAASEIAKLLYEVMKYNSTYGIRPGSVEDLEVRRGLYAEVLDLTDSLPTKLRPRSNFTPQTCLLR
jgi:hypothetical protein